MLQLIKELALILKLKGNSVAAIRYISICDCFLFIQYRETDRRSSAPPPVPPYPLEFTHPQYDQDEFQGQDGLENDLDRNNDTEQSESDEQGSEAENDRENKDTRDEVPAIFFDTIM